MVLGLICSHWMSWETVWTVKSTIYASKKVGDYDKVYLPEWSKLE